MGKLLSGAAVVDELILFLMLRPLLKYRRRKAVAVEDPEVLNPSLSDPLELLPPERIPMPFNWAAARAAVGVVGFELDVVLDVGVVGFEVFAVDVGVGVVVGVGVGVGVVVGWARLTGRAVDTDRFWVRGEAFELDAEAEADDAFSLLDCWPSASAIIAAERVLM